MSLKPDNEYCCLYMRLKTACFVNSYFLQVSQMLGVLMALWLFSTYEDVPKLLEGSNKDFWGNVATLAIAMGLTVVLSMALICFTVVLLVGLHRDNRRLIKIYLVFISFILIISVISCIVSEFVLNENRPVAFRRVLCFVLSVYLLFVIRNCWIKLDSNDPEPYQTVEE